MMMLMINLSSEFISNIYASDSRVRCQPVTMFMWPFVRTDRDRSRFMAKSGAMIRYTTGGVRDGFTLA